MKRKEKNLVSVVPSVEGVFHVSTSFNTNVYKAKGVKGRKVITKRLCIL